MLDRGNAAICPRCGGSGTVWDGGRRTTCGKCGGTGKRRVE